MSINYLTTRYLTAMNSLPLRDQPPPLPDHTDTLVVTSSSFSFPPWWLWYKWNKTRQLPRQRSRRGWCRGRCRGWSSCLSWRTCQSSLRSWTDFQTGLQRGLCLAPAHCSGHSSPPASSAATSERGRAVRCMAVCNSVCNRTCCSLYFLKKLKAEQKNDRVLLVMLPSCAMDNDFMLRRHDMHWLENWKALFAMCYCLLSHCQRILNLFRNFPVTYFLEPDSPCQRTSARWNQTLDSCPLMKFWRWHP